MAPKPFVPGGASTVPVALNKQYNTPISMYSVDNVMNSLSNKTADMNMGYVCQTFHRLFSNYHPVTELHIHNM